MVTLSDPPDAVNIRATDNLLQIERSGPHLAFLILRPSTEVEVLSYPLTEITPINIFTASDRVPPQALPAPSLGKLTELCLEALREGLSRLSYLNT